MELNFTLAKNYPYLAVFISSVNRVLDCNAERPCTKMPWNVGSEKIYQPQIDKQNNDEWLMYIVKIKLVSKPVVKAI